MVNMGPGKTVPVPPETKIEILPLPIYEVAKQIIAQNQAILEMNRELLRLLADPMYQVMTDK